MDYHDNNINMIVINNNNNNNKVYFIFCITYYILCLIWINIQALIHVNQCQYYS